MKKRLLTILCVLTATLVIFAIPANRTAVKVKQPDGSYLTLRLHGDEWNHTTTTADGYSVVRNAQGNYVYAQLQDGQLLPTIHVAHDAESRTPEEQNFLANVRKRLTPEMTPSVATMKRFAEKQQTDTREARRAAAAKSRRAGVEEQDYSKFRGLVILVQYNDKEFSRSDFREIKERMFNAEGYDGYVDTDGKKQVYTGSVRDYFSDNSLGLYQPQFDFYGPYTIDFSQYDANGVDNVAALTKAAVDLADEDVDFSKYDGDGDGTVDQIYFIFAGNGSNYEGNDERLLWPCSSVVYDPSTMRYIQKDGTWLYSYAVSVEFSGFTEYPLSVTIEGIGTICHELSHVLGLPDFYDTDYEEHGQSVDPGDWSVMANGGYSDYGRTPVGYSLFERFMAGFVSEIPTINAADNYTLEPLHIAQKGYLIESKEEEEVFLLENRQKSDFKWDAYLPGSGLLVHRVDTSNESVWRNNTINCDPNHNYYEVVRAGGLSHANTAYDVFPGEGKVRELHNATSPANLKTWSGKSTKWGLFDIQMVNGQITFEVRDACTLESLTLPESVTVAAGVTTLLQATPMPEYAEYTLTWTSSDEKVATVDAEGRVKGQSAGECYVTVTSDNGCTASCLVNVVEIDLCDIFDFKAKTDGDKLMLNLQDAEVLFVSGGEAYVRDASGAIKLSGVSAWGLKANDVINGVVMLEKGTDNKLPLAIATDDTNPEGLFVEAGPEVEPREVSLEDLTEDDYCDYLLVKAAKLSMDKEAKRVYAISGNRSMAYYNKLKVKIPALTNYEGNYFDLPVIYGTDVKDGEVFDELYILKSPTQVDAPTGVRELTVGDSDHHAPLYNLQGQRVGNSWRGLTISGGRKVLRK